MADEEQTTTTPETPAPPQGLGGQIRGTFDTLPAAQQAVIGLVAVAILVGFGTLIFNQAVGESMRAVARGLLPEDQQVAVTALETEAIPYELAEGGTILVPSSKIHEATIALAVGSSGTGKLVGFEIFDQSELGRSSFAEKVNYHRALEGEMSRTIQHMKSVDRARVHLVIPERRLFEEDEAEPSASVVVTLAPSASLARRQVEAIRTLVASGVERLSAQRVSVVDQSGTMLAALEDGDWHADESLEHQSKFERNLERRVVRLLETVVGVGKVRAQVAADLDFSTVVETQEKYDPESQVIRSEREKLESSASQDKVAAGVPGAGSNLPDNFGGANQAAGGGSNAERSDHIKNYEIDKSTLRRETPHARVDRLSVAVVVDSGLGADALAPAVVDQMKSLVTKAVGLNTTRGDEVEVVAMPFANEALAANVVAPTGLDALLDPQMRTLVGLGAIALTLLVLVVAFLRRSRRLARQRRESDERERALFEARLQEIAPSANELEAIHHEIDQLREVAVSNSGEDIRRTAIVIRRWIRDLTPGEAA
ncbi:MAG: flagellar M-ring protein FliF [Deltaproteobacteria bacterium]|nr:flagellar M-ring protein FliF [Deltaproteobacteria bacterium]